MLSARTAHDFLGPSHGQRIQTGSFFRDDGTGGVCRVWSYSVLHPSHGPWYNCGGAGGLCNRLESGRASSAGSNVTNRCRLKHDGSKIFQATGVRQPAELGPRIRKRLHGRIQQDASPAMNPPPLPIRKRFPWILYWIVLVFIVLFAFAPVGSVITCAWIANSHGCKVDEGSVHPCIINGKDYGQLLYTLGVLGWLMLVTIPGGLFAFVIWLIVLILHRASWRKRLAAGVPPPIPPSRATA